MSNVSLPEGFEVLESWGDWCLPTMDARRDRRIASTMDDIDAFYNAMLPQMDAVLEHLSATRLDGIDPKSEALMNLALSVAEIAPAVEQFGEPTVSYGYDMAGFAQGPQ